MRFTYFIVSWVLVLPLMVSGMACDSSNAPAIDQGVVADSQGDLVAPKDGGGGDQMRDSMDDLFVPRDAPLPACPPDTSTCVDETTQRVCRKQANGTWAWVQETCAAGKICLGTACSDVCADECNLGATRQVAGKPETCELYSIAQKTFVPLSKDGFHDRARRHNAWIRAHHLLGGTIGDVHFKTAALKTPAAYHGIGDSAIWTGTYLAAEALRLEVTGSKDALHNVEGLVDAVHRLLAANGHRGYLSRYAASFKDPDPLVVAQYRAGEVRHHKVTYQGADWFWIGGTSRDQYQGVLLGYSRAYDALPPGAHRDQVRNDMIAICDELMKERTLTVKVRFNLGGKWQEIPLSMKITNVILNPTEFKDGTPYIQIGADSNAGDVVDGSTMAGFREFWPDFHDVIQQIPLLGALLNFSMPRSGSAIMLAAIMRIGIQVTEGIPSAAAENAKFKAYYAKHIGTWLSKMKAYLNLNGAGSCWKSYYGNNFTWEPMWTLARLETDPAIHRQIVDEVMDAKMWPVVKDHKNVFFSYIYGYQVVPGPTITKVVDAAKAQLAQFQEAPKIKRAVDNTGKYPADSHCPNMTKVATDVKDRSVSDFNWQRDPFTMGDSGVPSMVYPGIDYLLPYWMARHYGWTVDDSAGSCLRWK
ncbi:MAG: hypothetical protein KAI47_18680 [Deltaproteobacteria bacterium]|nr:hypothetical protein [Deltaproteobacteria bacterium]